MKTESYYFRFPLFTALIFFCAGQLEFLWFLGETKKIPFGNVLDSLLIWICHAGIFAITGFLCGLAVEVCAFLNRVFLAKLFLQKVPEILSIAQAFLFTFGLAIFSAFMIYEVNDPLICKVGFAYYCYFGLYVLLLLLVFPLRAGLLSLWKKSDRDPKPLFDAFLVFWNLPLLPFWLWRRKKRGDFSFPAFYRWALAFSLLWTAVWIKASFDFVTFGRATRDAHQLFVLAAAFGLLSFCFLRKEKMAKAGGIFRAAAVSVTLLMPSAFLLFGVNEHRSYLLLHHTEFASTFTQTLRRFCDWDRDGQSSVFGAYDPDNWNSEKSLVNHHYDWDALGLAGPLEESPATLKRAKAPEEPKKKPNILFVTVDSMRKDHMECYGYNTRHPPVTPEFDKLSEEALLFNNASSPAPLTLLTIPSMFSGRYLAFEEKPPKETLPYLLRQNGYYCASVEFEILEKCDLGFEFRSTVPGPAGYRANALVEILRNRPAEKPFFCWIHYIDPHPPYYLMPDQNEKGERILPDYGDRIFDYYDSRLHYVDYFSGRLFQLLRESGLYDNTLIIVSSDHGEEFHEHGYYFHGYNLYQTLINVPLLIKLPEGRKAVLEDTVGLVDLTPTMLEYLGIESPAEFHGRSFAPLLEGKTLDGERPPLFFQGRWTDKFGLRLGDWKLTFDRYLYYFELYNVIEDPGEYKNLISLEPEKAQKLKALLYAWLWHGRETYANQKFRAADPLYPPGGLSSFLDLILSHNQRMAWPLPLFGVYLFLGFLSFFHSPNSRLRFAVTCIALAAIGAIAGGVWSFVKPESQFLRFIEKEFSESARKALEEAKAGIVINSRGRFESVYEWNYLVDYETASKNPLKFQATLTHRRYTVFADSKEELLAILNKKFYDPREMDLDHGIEFGASIWSYWREGGLWRGEKIGDE